MDRITHSDDWIALTDRAPLPQHWAYGLAMQAIGVGVERALHDGRPVQILSRPGLRLIHRVDPGLSLVPLARHPGLTLVSTTTRHGRLLPLITARHHAIWDISGSPEALMSRLRPTWRHSLARSTARIVEDARSAEEIVARSEALGRVRGYRLLPWALVRNWPGGTLVLTCGKPFHAGAVFLIHGAEASYHAAWADAEGKQVGAPRALLWRAAGILSGMGISRIDLGRFDSASPGLAQFKLGTGAAAVNLGPTSLVLPF